MGLIVHGGLPSPFVRKVLICLEEKGVPYEWRPIAPFPKSPELLALNPLGQIPIAGR
jgi:glutathione S-transferase